MRKWIAMLPLAAAALFGQTTYTHAQSCNGRQATFATRAETFAANVRVAVAERPRPVVGMFGALLDRRAEAKEHRAEARVARAEAHTTRGGCSGGAATFQTTQTFRVVQTAPPTRAGGCSGGAATFGSGWPANPPSVPPVYDPTMHAAGKTVAAGGLIQRAAVHRVLHKAVRQGKLAPDELATLQARPDLYEKAVDASTKIIAKGNVAAAPGIVGALGDGHILQMLLQNLPAIIDAIKQILALFAMADPLPPLPQQWLPMPTGPPPAGPVTPPYALVV